MTELLRRASAVWSGTLREGAGKVSTASGALKDADVTFASRFENAPASNPEELLAAAHASCFSMKLSGVLTGQGHAPTEIRSSATLTMSKLESGWKITRVHIETEGKVEGIDAATFKAAAEEAKETCPVSVLLKPGLEEVSLDARLAA